MAEDTKQADPATVAAAGIDEDEDLTPTPTQEELDNVKLGLHHTDGAKTAAYKTRQSRAN